MPKIVQAFFDYVCPYCCRGILAFLDMLPDYPEVQVDWKPCEAHPRPEYAPIHSDVAAQAMLCLQDQGGDLIRFHRLVFQAYFEKRMHIDDPQVLADLAAACGGDGKAVYKALQARQYAAAVVENNRLAWDELGLFAVPSYRTGNRLAGSRDGILVSKNEVAKLLSEA